MSVNSNVANFLWIGDSLSIYEHKCIESFEKNGFVVNVFSYSQALAVPDRVQLRDARDILPEHEVYTYTQGGAKGSLAAFSDVFRYELCKKRMGWWFDADVFCLKHVSAWQALCEQNKGRVIVGKERPDYINGAVIYSDNVDFDLSIHHSLQQIGKTFEWGAIGPALITQTVKSLNMMSAVQDEKAFYPIYYHDLEKMFKAEHLDYCQDVIQASYSIHLWNEVFRQYAIPKNIPPPKNCFMYELLKTHSPVDEKYAIPESTMNALFEMGQLKELRMFKDNVERMKIYRLYNFIKFW